MATINVRKPTDNIERKARLSTLSQGVSLHSHLLIGTLIFLIALGFNCYQLGTASLWFDEAFSVELVRHSFSQFWTILFAWQPNMELYYLFLYGWLHLLAIFGVPATEFAVRFPTAVFAALSAVVVFALGKRFLSTGAGILGASLYFLNPHELIYAQQTRAYSLQLFLLCLSWYMLFAAFMSGKRWNRYWIGFTVVMILAIYAHLMSGLMLVTQVIFIGSALLVPNWRAFIRPRLLAFGSSLVAIGLGLLPLVPVVRHGDPTFNWLPAPHLHDMYWIFQVITGANKWYLRITVISIFFGLLLVGLSIARRTARGQAMLTRQLEQRPAVDDLLSHKYSGLVLWGLLCWLVLPIILSFVISQTKIHIFSERYLVVIIPAFCLLVSLGIAALRSRAIPVRAVQVLLAVFLLGWTLQLAMAYYPGAQIEDWRSAAQWVMAHYQPHDGLVCYDNNEGCEVAMDYYFETYPQNRAHFAANTPGATSFWTSTILADSKQAISPGIVSKYAAKYQRLFYITGRAPSDVQGIWQWLDQHYHLIGEMQANPGISIRLYEIRSLNSAMVSWKTSNATSWTWPPRARPMRRT